MSTKKLFLGGGGDEVSAREIDDLYGKTLGNGAKVLYIPVALEGSPDYSNCLNWFTGAFKRFGFHTEMLTDLSHCSYQYLAGFDSIYIGGGNTFSLLHTFRTTNFIEPVTQFINSGKVVFGGSAGAIIFGKDIRTATLGACSDINKVGMQDFSGFNMVNNYAIHCHYEQDGYSEIEQFSKENKLNLLALTDESGLYIEGDTINYIGEVTIFISNANALDAL